MSINSTEVEWGRCKASEIAQLAQRNAIAIIPIGATEQHGPHLAVQVDYRLATEISLCTAKLLSEKYPAVVLPTIPFGMSEHHVMLNGTISIDYTTMSHLLNSVCISLVRAGFQRIFILNGHGGNDHGISLFVGEFTSKHRIPLCYATYWSVAKAEIADILDEQSELLHACEAETSMMLAVSPDLVDQQLLPQIKGGFTPGLSAIPRADPGIYRWRELSSVSGNVVVGQSFAATAEKGEKLIQAISQRLASALLNERLWIEPI